MADSVEQARKHFAEGVKRYEEGDYEGARALFQQADAEHHAAVIVYNIARAEERLPHPQAAVDAYEAYIAEAGEKGEFTQAAVMAIVRIKTSARQLRIETKPPGARLFVDGALMRDPAPARVLVPAGRHHIVAEGEGWRAEADVDTGPSRVETVTLLQPEGSTASTVTAPEAPPSTTTTPPATPLPAIAASAAPPPPAPPATYEGFVFGAEFVAIPHRFDVTPNKPYTSFGLAAGLMAEAGYAASEDFLVLGRVLLGIGSKGVPATSIGAVGAALSYRVHRSVWVGAAFMGGRAILPGAIVPGPEEQRRFDTDYVFCPTLELSMAVLNRPYGQWLVSVLPGYYFAGDGDNELLFIPVGLGLRTF